MRPLHHPAPGLVLRMLALCLGFFPALFDVGPIRTILDRLPSRLPFVTRVRAEMLGAFARGAGRGGTT
jgi:hypothetical protein